MSTNKRSSPIQKVEICREHLDNHVSISDISDRFHVFSNYACWLIAEQDILVIEHRFNNRPRKLLNFQTPNNIFLVHRLHL